MRATCKLQMQSNERSERKQLDQPLNEKEKESRQIDLKNADSSDLRSSLDTGIIDQQQKQPSMLHGLDECSPARYPTSTVWECESATPMTSRPHFSPHFKRPHRPQKHSPILQASLAATRHVRQRSKSLGSEYHDERMALLFGEPDWIRPTLGLYGTMQTRRGSGDKAEAHEKRKNSTSSGSAANSERLESNTTAAVPEPVIDGRATTNLGTIVADASTAFDTTSNPVWIDVLYGIINATMVLPITMSFASIIYRDDAFAPYIPIFVKLTIASGVVHQLCFSTFSSLPFAVGQVQDAGLIFLSGMATNIVQYCQAPNNNASLETMLATVTIGLSLATALLGCGLLLVGHLRLAAYMQLLPTWYDGIEHVFIYRERGVSCTYCSNCAHSFVIVRLGTIVLWVDTWRSLASFVGWQGLA